MKKLNINLELTLQAEAPENMNGQEVCEVLFRAMRGEGNPQYGINMRAEMAWAVPDLLNQNLKGMKLPVECTHIASYSIRSEDDPDCSDHVLIKGDGEWAEFDPDCD